MGNISSFIGNLFSRTKEARILVLGLDAAGKTTILYKLKLGETISTLPTIGFNVETVQVHNVRFTMWDVGGQEKIRVLWKHYFLGTQGLVFVIDSNDTSRIDEATKELKFLLDQVGCIAQSQIGVLSFVVAMADFCFVLQDEMHGASLLVLANKQDLPCAMSLPELRQKLDLDRIASGRKWMIQPCCAPTGDGLFEGFDWLAANLPSK
eukprot:c4631_g1_i1.p1 GENE.c4631_g1_i1~~c4631_g1_i1.p1  ORF type:complete len:208 (+),score=53.78 c4631_g1_i1:113-736(+)